MEQFLTLDQYSTLLAVGTFALGGVSLLSLIAYALSSKISGYIRSIRYSLYLNVIGVIVFFSIIGAFIFQLSYLTPVCEMCWWQRVFMFPLAVIIPVGLYFKSRGVHVMTGTLSLFGMFFAGYHYYFHYQILVLGNALSLPCSAGLLPACTESPILIWGFVTIPLLAFLGFFSIFAVSVLAHRANQN